MMTLKLSESTAARRRIPFVCVDATDGITPEVSLTFSAGDLKISKNGATEANHAGTVTEIAQGGYFYEFTSGELDTRGFLTLRTNKANVAIRYFFAQVIDNDLNGNLNSNTAAINGNTAHAGTHASILNTIVLGTVNTVNVAATTTTFQATGITEQTADHYNGRQIIFTTGVMLGSAARITDYAWDAGNSEGMFTISAAQEVPVNGTNFRIV